MSDLLSRAIQDPTVFIDACYDEAFRMSRTDIATLQLEGARRRFEMLRPKLAVLDRLAEDQGVERIDTIEDIAPLLFNHTVYKSYPLSFLERSRFDKLTKWLSGLTTIDLSEIDASDVHSIDDWLDLIEAKTQLLVQHTSGTTGKLSFIPRTKEQWRQTIVHSTIVLRDWWGPKSGPDMLQDGRPIIIPGYRYGASAQQRGNAFMIEYLAHGDENALFMYPDARFSADLASLAGRLRAAEARGEAGMVEISPALLERRQQLVELERRRPEDLKRFFDDAVRRFGGQDVYIAAVWPILYDWAREGLERGLKGIFGPGSILLTGGGKKGKDLPEDWRDQSLAFMGSSNCYEMYAISEQMGLCMMCEKGHYHIPPFIVPFLLDPETGRPLPRKDGLTGRYASLDLLPETYWAGLVTGDEITMSGWESDCACGRHGAYIIPPIRRYSEKEGGDDKVVCAGAPEAHDRALEFLVELSA